MRTKQKLFKNWRSGLAGAGCSVLFGWVFLIFGVGSVLTDLSFDLPFAFRGTIMPKEVIILYMDEESHRVLNQPRFDLWNRDLHAQLIDKLRQAGAKAIVFDLLFDTTNNPAADEALVRAVRAHGSVAVSGVVGDIIINWQRNGVLPIEPFPALQDAVAAWGMVEKSDDGRTVRRHYQGEYSIPSLAWTVASLTLSNLPAPAQERWMNYYGPRLTIPHESYVHVLSNAVSVADLTNKVIYVGAGFNVPYSGGRGADEFITPYTRWGQHTKSPGVEVNATAYLNLARGDWLRRPSPVAELVIFFLTGIVLGYGLTRLNPLPAAGMGAAVCLTATVIGCVMPWVIHIWFPWLILAAVQVPVSMLCATLFGLQKSFLPRPGLMKEAVSAAETRSSATELLTSEVLQHLQRLRESSATPPAFSPPAAKDDMARSPIVPDHELLRCVGRGAYGEVWLAKTVMGSYRAAKIVFRKNFQEARPYEREFEGIRKFEPISRKHPGLVQILHIGRDDAAAYYYYLMETADDSARGQQIVPESYSPKTLAKIIKDQGLLPARDCLRLAASLTLALDYLHGQGLIHRDIKPSNIIFVNGEPKLADIGLVTDIGDNKTFVGTAGYYPPEGPGTPSADLYSLGKVLYELVTGLGLERFPELPTSFNASEHLRELFELNNIILKACEANVNRRYQSANEMHRDLERVMQKKPRWFGRT